MPGIVNESTPLLTENEEVKQRTAGNSASCCNKFGEILSAITVEPAIFFYALCYGLESVFSTNLWVDKICKDSYSPEVCKNLDSGNYPQQQDDVQRKTNDFNVYIHIIEYLPGTFMVLLLGAWSDRRNRKFPILLCLFGLLMKGLLLTANCYWWNLPSLFLLISYTPVGLTGSVIGFYGASYAYVSAITSGRSRTTRVAVISIVLHVFSPCGQELAEILFDKGGYIAIFGTYSLLVAVSFLYCLLRLQKLSGEDRREEPTSVCQVLSPVELKKTLLVAFRVRENGGRGDILAYLAVMTLYMFGRESKLYHFLFCRKKFSWEYDKYTLWSIIDLSISAAGELLLLPTLSYVFQVNDGILGFVGGVSSLFCYILRATATAPWIFYLSSVVGLSIEMVSASTRAAMSKLVEKEELGAIFAIVSSAEAITPTIAPAIYTLIYNATLEVFPGTIFLVSAAVTVVILIIFAWILTRRIETGIHRNQNQRIEKKQASNDQHT